MIDLIGIDSMRQGLTVESVEYHLLWFESPPKPQIVDVVSMAVEINFGDAGRARFHWRIDPTFEGLEVGPWKVGDAATELSHVDATDRWGLSGARLARYVVATQLTDRGEAQMPWSCRLVFEDDRNLVIALGELSPEGQLTYLPDSLIVTASQEVACGYRLDSSASTAWVEGC